MTPATAILVGLGGGLGAILRFLVDGRVSVRTGTLLPFGTLAVNLSGAFGLGLLAGAAPGRGTTLVLGAGVLGGYTTFSTWMFETHRLGEDGRLAWGAANLAASLLLGLAGVAAGRVLGTGL